MCNRRVLHFTGTSAMLKTLESYHSYFHGSTTSFLYFIAVHMWWLRRRACLLLSSRKMPSLFRCANVHSIISGLLKWLNSASMTEKLRGLKMYFGEIINPFTHLVFPELLNTICNDEYILWKPETIILYSGQVET